MKYSIKYGVNPPTKTFEINELEENFFDVLYSKLPENVNKHINLIRMTNGTLTVDCKGFFIGKIKLQGNKHDMLILTSLYASYVANNNFIEHIYELLK